MSGTLEENIQLNNFVAKWFGFGTVYSLTVLLDAKTLLGLTEIF